MTSKCKPKTVEASTGYFMGNLFMKLVEKI